MNTLVACVGENGKNLHQDVILVQTLLKSIGYDPGRVDGICGNRTVAAIKKFQKTFLSQPDGLIEPVKATWLKLSATDHSVPCHRTTEWSGDSSKWPQDKKLKSLHPDLRPKVTCVLRTLADRGYQPQVFYGWRSVNIQLQLYNKGNSKVKFSFHNVQKRDGTPNSYAVDIIDSRYGWSKEAETSGFWKALGEEAKKQSLVWGGEWTAFRDVAHVQLVPNSQLQQVKVESGL